MLIARTFWAQAGIICPLIVIDSKTRHRLKGSRGRTFVVSRKLVLHGTFHVAMISIVEGIKPSCAPLHSLCFEAFAIAKR